MSFATVGEISVGPGGPLKVGFTGGGRIICLVRIFKKCWWKIWKEMLYYAANERAEQELQFALLKSKNGQKFFENGPNYCRDGKI